MPERGEEAAPFRGLRGASGQRASKQERRRRKTASRRSRPSKGRRSPCSCPTCRPWTAWTWTAGEEAGVSQSFLARASRESKDLQQEPPGWPSGRRRGRPRRSGPSTRCNAGRQSSERPLAPARKKVKGQRWIDALQRCEMDLLRRDGPLRRLAELLDRPRVAPEVLLAADEDDGQV